MAIVLINPNSTEAMTDAMVSAARAAAPDLTFEGWTSREGPPSIQGAADGAAATGPLLALIDQAQGASGIIIGCFDDTGLEDAATRAPCPVVGLGQAAYHLCAMRNWRFSVVTTLSVSVPVLEENLTRCGLDAFASKVRASEVPVLELEASPDAALQAIRAEAKAALAEDAIDAIILGCGGMVHVSDALNAELPIPVIDPVVAAAQSMTWLAER